LNGRISNLNLFPSPVFLHLLPLFQRGAGLLNSTFNPTLYSNKIDFSITRGVAPLTMEKSTYFLKNHLILSIKLSPIDRNFSNLPLSVGEGAETEVWRRITFGSKIERNRQPFPSPPLKTSCENCIVVLLSDDNLMLCS
jgi:hypothetical protein